MTPLAMMTKKSLTHNPERYKEHETLDILGYNVAATVYIYHAYGKRLIYYVKLF